MKKGKDTKTKKVKKSKSKKKYKANVIRSIILGGILITSTTSVVACRSASDVFRPFTDWFKKVFRKMIGAFAPSNKGLATRPEKTNFDILDENYALISSIYSSKLTEKEFKNIFIPPNTPYDKVVNLLKMDKVQVNSRVKIVAFKRQDSNKVEYNLSLGDESIIKRVTFSNFATTDTIKDGDSTTEGSVNQVAKTLSLTKETLCTRNEFRRLRFEEPIGLSVAKLALKLNLNDSNLKSTKVNVSKTTDEVVTFIISKGQISKTINVKIKKFRDEFHTITDSIGKIINKETRKRDTTNFTEEEFRQIEIKPGTYWLDAYPYLGLPISIDEINKQLKLIGHISGTVAKFRGSLEVYYSLKLPDSSSAIPIEVTFKHFAKSANAETEYSKWIKSEINYLFSKDVKVDQFLKDFINTKLSALPIKDAMKRMKISFLSFERAKVLENLNKLGIKAWKKAGSKRIDFLWRYGKTTERSSYDFSKRSVFILPAKVKELLNELKEHNQSHLTRKELKDVTLQNGDLKAMANLLELDDVNLTKNFVAAKFSKKADTNEITVNIPYQGLQYNFTLNIEGRWPTKVKQLVDFLKINMNKSGYTSEEFLNIKIDDEQNLERVMRVLKIDYDKNQKINYDGLELHISKSLNSRDIEYKIISTDKEEYIYKKDNMQFSWVDKSASITEKILGQIVDQFNSSTEKEKDFNKISFEFSYDIYKRLAEYGINFTTDAINQIDGYLKKVTKNLNSDTLTYHFNIGMEEFEKKVTINNFADMQVLIEGNEILTVAKMNDGLVVAGTNGNLQCLVNDGTMTPNINLFKGHDISNIIRDDDGGYWLTSSNGYVAYTESLNLLSDKTPVKQIIKGNIKHIISYGKYAILMDNQGRATTIDRNLAITKVRSFTTEIENLNIYSLDFAMNFYFLINSDGTFSFINKYFDNFKESANKIFANSYATCSTSDNNGGIFVASNLNMIYHIDKTGNIVKKYNIGRNHVNVMKYVDGQLYIGVGHNGIIVINEKDNTITRNKMLNGDYIITKIEKMGENIVYISHKGTIKMV